MPANHARETQAIGAVEQRLKPLQTRCVVGLALRQMKPVQARPAVATSPGTGVLAEQLEHRQEGTRLREARQWNEEPAEIDPAACQTAELMAELYEPRCGHLVQRRVAPASDEERRPPIVVTFVEKHLACALAQSACRRGLRALYRRVPRLFDGLALAKADGTYTKAKLKRADVLVLDPARSRG